MASRSVSSRLLANKSQVLGPLARSTFCWLFLRSFLNCAVNETDSKVIKFYGTSQLANYIGQLAPQSRPHSPFSPLFLNCLVQKSSQLLLIFCHIIPLDAATLAWSQGDFHYEYGTSLGAYQRLSVDWACPRYGVGEGNFDFVQCKMLAICWQAQPLCVDKPTKWRRERMRRGRREANAVWREHKFSCC